MAHFVIPPSKKYQFWIVTLEHKNTVTPTTAATTTTPQRIIHEHRTYSIITYYWTAESLCMLMCLWWYVCLCCCCYCRCLCRHRIQYTTSLHLDRVYYALKIAQVKLEISSACKAVVFMILLLMNGLWLTKKICAYLISDKQGLFVLTVHTFQYCRL